MRSPWPTESLGEICDVQIGKTPTRAEQRFWGGDHAWLSISDMNQGRFLSTTSERVTDEAVRSLRLRLVEPGTVLLSFKLSIGKVGIACAPMYTNEAIAHLPIVDDRIDRDFLYRALQTVPLARGADRAAMGATLNKSKLKQIPIPLPPIEEQRRISKVLDAAENLRDRRQDTLAKLGTLTQAVFIDMFREITEPTVELGELAVIQGGLQVSSKRKSNPIEVPYLRVANVYRGFLALDEVKTMRVTQQELERTTLKLGDLLVVEGHGNSAEIGRVGLWDGSIDGCVHQNHLIRVRCDQSQLLPRFAEAYLNSWVGRRELLRAANTTSGLNTISTSDVRGVRIPVPRLTAQERFVRAARAVDSHRLTVMRGLHYVDELFASLQQRAFRGEL